MSFKANFKDDLGGPLYYFGNRALTLPNKMGRMHSDSSWMKDSFAIIEENRRGKPFKRCFEPFCGSASWSFAAMEIGFSQEYYINDVNHVLIYFFNLVKNDPNPLKEKYISLSKEYQQSNEKVHFYKNTINQYNNSSDQERALLLPFIINYSWGGMIFYDKNNNLTYEEITLGDKLIPGCIETPPLSLENFVFQINRISNLLNKNQVYFSSQDFEKSIEIAKNEDFVILNPPYPENQRSSEKNNSLYTEIHSPKTLHSHLCKVVESFEHQGITYLMSYGTYCPSKKFVLHTSKGQTPFYLRLIGGGNSVFGKILDQMYLSSTYKIPTSLNTKIIPASLLSESNRLSHKQVLEKFFDTEKNC